MPPIKVKRSVHRCPQCGKPMQEVSYQWNPLLPDSFDVFVGCPDCGIANPESSEITEPEPSATGRGIKSHH